MSFFSSLIIWMKPMIPAASATIASHASGFIVYPAAAKTVVSPWYVEGSFSLLLNQYNIVCMDLGVNNMSIGNIGDLINFINTLLKLLLFLIEGALTLRKRLFSTGLCSNPCAGILVCPDDILNFIWIYIKMNKCLSDANSCYASINKCSHNNKAMARGHALPNLICGNIHSEAF